MYGSVPAVAGLSVHETGEGKIRRTRIVFDGMVVTMADNPAVTAFGSQKIYDFAEGLINVLGARGELTRVERTAGSVSTGIFDAFNGDFGVGTVAANNTATPLATTEQNIVPNTDTAQAVAGVSAGGKGVSTTIPGAFDGTATAVDLFLNMLVDDINHDITSLPSNLKVWGEVTVDWVDIGDK